MIDCLTPASLKVSNMLDAAITIAIVPNASGASILARSIFPQIRSLYGADQWLDSENLRDEPDPHRDL